MSISDKELIRFFKKYEDVLLENVLKDLPSDEEIAKLHPVSKEFDERILKIIRGTGNDKDK